MDMVKIVNICLYFRPIKITFLLFIGAFFLPSFSYFKRREKGGEMDIIFQGGAG